MHVVIRTWLWVSVALMTCSCADSAEDEWVHRPTRLIAVSPDVGDGRISTVASDGTVTVVEANDLSVLTSVETGTESWGTTVDESTPIGPRTARVRGIPIARAKSETVAVVDSALVSWDDGGVRRVLCTDPALAGATVVTAMMEGSWLVGTEDGHVVAVSNGRARRLSGELGEPVRVIVARPDRNGAVVAGAGPELAVIDVGRGTVVREDMNRLGDPAVHVLAFSRNGHQLAVSHGFDFRLKLIDRSFFDGEGVGDFYGVKRGGTPCLAVDYHPSGLLIACGDGSGAVRVFPTGHHDNLPRPGHHVGFADDNDSVVFLGSEGSVDLQTGRSWILPELGSWRVHTAATIGVTWTSDDRLLALSESGEAAVLSWPDGVIIRRSIVRPTPR